MVDKLFYCEICRSKVLESRLEKHHAKVHSSLSFDNYKPLTNVASPNTVNTKVADITSVRNVWGIESPTDVRQVHVRCTVCCNKMLPENLDGHMKRKHPEPIDQVDAIGTMVDAMTVNNMEKPIPDSTLSQRRINSYFNKPSVSHFGSAGQTESKNDVIDFDRSFRPAINFQPTAQDGSSNDTTFYTIRVNEAQMQELLNNNRIYPKDGAFYLK